MNLAEVLQERIEEQPGHSAILGPEHGEQKTYRQLGCDISKAAKRLLSLGISSGDSVGLSCPSGYDYIVLTYALWRCQACTVPIPVELAREEKEQICTEIHLDGIITSRDTLEALQQTALSEPGEVLTGNVFVKIQSNVTQPEGFETVNAAFLRFTSGTTGASKGVVLSHETILARIRAANAGLRIGPEDRIVWLLSMSYHFAVSIVAYLSFGASVVLCRNSFGSTIVQTIERHRATIIYASPMHFQLMANARGENSLDSLRLCVSTTTQLPVHIFQAFFDRFGISISEAYGIIEIGLPCINFDRPEDKRGSVGRLLPEYEILIAEPAPGKKEGNIKIKGAGIFDAYYAPWQTRGEVMADGWFETGDMGHLDADGFLFISGRDKDVISVSGIKFFPQEIETVLNLHPAVKESRVYSIPHQLLGEVPVAEVVPASVADLPSEADLKDYCFEHLAGFKVPARVQLVDKLPRTASGKLIRR